ncbi:MAG TPA: GAF domain-containing protein [Bryobacteraceae bacterium]|nr:GAF domain-containing protein [Bryobacteraceae bacterium]
MPIARRANIRFRERAELLDFLLEVASVMSETLDLDKLLPLVSEYVGRVIPYDLFALLLYSEKAQGLRIRYARGHRDEVVRSLVIPLGEGLTGIAAETRQTVLSTDVRNDPRYLPAVDAVRSELAVPMILRGRLVGVIDVQSTRENAYAEQDASLLRLLAARVVTSIENARLHQRVQRQNRVSRMLVHLAQEFSSILNLDELLSTIAKTLKVLINYDAFSVLLVDPERQVLRHRFSERYDQRVALDNIPIGRGLTGAAAKTREIVRVNDTLADPRYIASHPDIRSEIAVPLVVQDRVVGVLDLESDRLAYFTDEHVRVLSQLAPQIASSVENARLYEELAQREQRMEHDLKAARKVQSILLPREAPELPGLEAAIALRPAREITGDLYEFFAEHDYGVVAFGDSSGKGAAAALYGSLVSGLLRSIAPRMRRPGPLLRKLNETLLERKVDAQYVTLSLLHWDVGTRQMTVANAGSTPPLLFRRGQRTDLHVEGVSLGLLEDRGYEEMTTVLESGDVLLLYSDGVADQMNASGEDFGSRRLVDVLQQVADGPARQIVDSILQDLDRWAEGGAMQDDQTLVAMKIL